MYVCGPIVHQTTSYSTENWASHLQAYWGGELKLQDVKIDLGYNQLTAKLYKESIAALNEQLITRERDLKPMAPSPGGLHLREMMIR